jgi:phosphatidylethanolamine-binding protein (PEBP) family uncharacterized protein
MAPLAVVAAAFAVAAPWPNGGTIPKRYTCDGANRAPVLRVRALRPPFAIEAIDVDAPGGRFVHWLALGGIPGRNSAGTLGYTGPCPPPGDPPHRYVFHVYELRRRPNLRPGFTDAQLRTAIRGDVVASGTVVGRYGR